MSTRTLNPRTLRKMGLKALADTLGTTGMVRFIQQFERGEGDYTKDRDLWLKPTDVRSVVKEIKEKQKRK